MAEAIIARMFAGCKREFAIGVDSRSRRVVCSDRKGEHIFAYPVEEHKEGRRTMIRRGMPMDESDPRGPGHCRRALAESGHRAYRSPWWPLTVAVVLFLLIWQPTLGRMAAEQEGVAADQHAAMVEPRLRDGGEVRLQVPGNERIWVVAPGDTLWTIARQVAPGQDPRRTVEILRQANGLRSAALRIGQHLVIPAGLASR